MTEKAEEPDITVIIHLAAESGNNIKFGRNKKEEGCKLMKVLYIIQTKTESPLKRPIEEWPIFCTNIKKIDEKSKAHI